MKKIARSRRPDTRFVFLSFDSFSGSLILFFQPNCNPVDTDGLFLTPIPFTKPLFITMLANRMIYYREANTVIDELL